MAADKTPVESSSIRAATGDDAEALLAIYAPVVLHSATSFELSPPSTTQFAERIERAHLWLLAENRGGVLGYAYGGSFRSRAAYRWTVETSAYVDQAARGRGVGEALYRELLTQLAGLGFCNAYAGIALPNEASVALHRKVGFQAVGVFARAGHKFGRWHDVSWWQLRLRDEPPEEAAPKQA